MLRYYTHHTTFGSKTILGWIYYIVHIHIHICIYTHTCAHTHTNTKAMSVAQIEACCGIFASKFTKDEAKQPDIKERVVLVHCKYEDRESWRSCMVGTHNFKDWKPWYCIQTGSSTVHHNNKHEPIHNAHVWLVFSKHATSNVGALREAAYKGFAKYWRDGIPFPSLQVVSRHSCSYHIPCITLMHCRCPGLNASSTTTSWTQSAS